jgi:dTDP-4-dehydrorhamnose 3,5-epimerase
MKVHQTALPGLLKLEPFVAPDARGLFAKTFQRDEFAANGLETEYSDEYVTVSHPGVLRGMHFQIPPHAQTKLVCCVAGKVLDAIVDLRGASPTYGQHAKFELSLARPEILFVPAGFAHGFCVLDGPAVMFYKVSVPYSPTHDRGIRWDSAGIPWPLERPILSERDRQFPPLAEFGTPFV